MSKKTDLLIPGYVEKAMGINTDDEKINELKEKYPNATILQWSKIAASAWYYLSTSAIAAERAQSAINGIFPPNLIIDRTHTPTNGTDLTDASIHMIWHDAKDDMGQLTYIIPTQCEVRVYEKNILITIRTLLQRSIPTSALIAYMMHVIMHEYLHYIEFYNYSYKAWKEHDNAIRHSGEDRAEKMIARWHMRVNNFDKWINNPNDVVPKNEVDVERSAVIYTLNHMANVIFGISTVEKVTRGCNIVPGSEEDMKLRDIGNSSYNAAALMCQYLHYMALMDDPDFCAEADSDDDYWEQLDEEIEIIRNNIRKHGKGMSRKKLILLE